MPSGIWRLKLKDAILEWTSKGPSSCSNLTSCSVWTRLLRRQFSDIVRARSRYASGGEWKGKCAGAPGFYEDTPERLLPPDFVMPPAGKGPLSDGPLHPRAPGAPPLGTLRRPAPHSFRRQLPSGAGRLRAIWRRECVCALCSRRSGGTRESFLHVACGAHPRRRSFRLARPRR